MHLNLSPELQGNAAAEEAARIVGKCVHCGFCNASCPTYRLLGDELDGPRGRIYLMKGLLEGVPATAKTQLHLDRCLTCRACESACPSGVDYGRLLDTGRALSSVRSPRTWGGRLARALLRGTLTRPWLFGALLRIGQTLRPALPPQLREKVPVRTLGPVGPVAPVGFKVSPISQAVSPAPPSSAQRRVLLLSGCVQPALSPGIHHATVRVLAALGIEAVTPPTAGCCGAITSTTPSAPSMKPAATLTPGGRGSSLHLSTLMLMRAAPSTRWLLRARPWKPSSATPRAVVCNCASTGTCYGRTRFTQHARRALPHWLVTLHRL